MTYLPANNRLITAPIAEPVTLAEAKAHLRIDDTGSDSLITALIVAARQSAEHELQRAIAPQTREVTMDAFRDEIRLAYAPVTAVESVKYVDTNAVLQTVPTTEYAVDTDSEPGVMYLLPGKAWPSIATVKSAVRIRYTCGYVTCPQAIKQWMLLRIGTMFENRESAAPAAMTALPHVDCLLDPYRIWVL